jgi:hypothetical protein
MSGFDGRESVKADSARILEELSIRQHLQPHRLVREVLCDAQQELGLCTKAVQTAMEWLQLDGEQAIGRLRRSELIQLSRSIQRFWRQSLAEGVPYPQPA